MNDCNYHVDNIWKCFSPIVSLGHPFLLKAQPALQLKFFYQISHDYDVRKAQSTSITNKVKKTAECLTANHWSTNKLVLPDELYSSRILKVFLSGTFIQITHIVFLNKRIRHKAIDQSFCFALCCLKFCFIQKKNGAAWVHSIISCCLLYTFSSFERYFWRFCWTLKREIGQHEFTRVSCIWKQLVGRMPS